MCTIIQIKQEALSPVGDKFVKKDSKKNVHTDLSNKFNQTQIIITYIHA